MPAKMAAAACEGSLQEANPCTGNQGEFIRAIKLTAENQALG